MLSRLVFREEHLAQLRDVLFSHSPLEGAAFILCGEARMAGLRKLMSHTVVPIAAEDFLERSTHGLSIGSRALTRIAKLARFENLSIVFAHSHPLGGCAFSDQDDREEEQLIPFLQGRVPVRLHGTVVLTEDSIVGRVYGPERSDISTILSIGSRIRILRSPAKIPLPRFYDRQVRAFGTESQAVLGALRIGVVGLGGTGSIVAEQLYRLGVGELALFDGDCLEDSNLNRVYGSRRSDVGVNKATIAKRHLDAIGLQTKVDAFPEPILYEHVARELTTCDVVFGCTDKQIPRGILVQVSLRYATPVIDLGVLLDSVDGQIRGVHGRVTTLLLGEACLLCRERISAEGMRIEALSAADRQTQILQGYAPELAEPAPAVIAFTSAVASQAVMELLHRITGFMGPDRKSTEVLMRFDETQIRTNRLPSGEACLCSTESLFASGDEDPYLGMIWPTYTK